MRQITEIAVKVRPGLLLSLGSDWKLDS